jgi:hypothetical protein
MNGASSASADLMPARARRACRRAA